MKNYLLHIPTRSLHEVKDKKDADKILNSTEYPSEDFMLVKDTLKDKILQKVIEISIESQEETEYSPLFMRVVDLIYGQMTTKSIASNHKKLTESLKQMAVELHEISFIYTSELKLEKLTLKELAKNIDDWMDAIAALEATKKQEFFIQEIAAYNLTQLKTFNAICDEMLETRETPENPEFSEVMKKYHEIIWSKPEIAQATSKDLNLNHEDTNLVIHIKCFLEKTIKVFSE